MHRPMQTTIIRFPLHKNRARHANVRSRAHTLPFLPLSGLRERVCREGLQVHRETEIVTRGEHAID
jgi:hypothetical protein